MLKKIGGYSAPKMRRKKWPMRSKRPVFLRCDGGGGVATAALGDCAEGAAVAGGGSPAL